MNFACCFRCFTDVTKSTAATKSWGGRHLVASKDALLLLRRRGERPAGLELILCNDRRQRCGDPPASWHLLFSSSSRRCFSSASFISRCLAYNSSSLCFSFDSFSCTCIRPKSRQSGALQSCIAYNRTFCWKTIFISASIFCSLASCRDRSSCIFAAGLISLNTLMSCVTPIVINFSDLYRS